MSIRIDVYAVDAEKERVWVNELRALLSSIEDIQIFLGNQQEPHGQIILMKVCFIHCNGVERVEQYS